MADRPTLVGAISAFFESELAEVNTSFPARVVAYDATRQTVDVQPVVRDWVDNEDGSVEWEDWPVIYGVPVAFPRAGGFHITLPIAAGDHVRVVCSQLPTIAWRTSGETRNAGLLERHGLNGCIAFLGEYPTPQKITPPPSTTDLVISSDDGSSAIVVKQDGEVRLGDANASSFVALANLVDAELTKISTTLSSLAGQASFGTPYSKGNVSASKTKAT